MINTKTVEITWVRRTKQWYINKGYLFTKLGDKFLADVDDLTDGCQSEVDLTCDKCGKLLKNKIYAQVVKARKKRKKNNDYCQECAHNIIDINIVKKLFTEKGYTILFKDKDYKNAKTKLPYICSTHLDEIQYICYDKLKIGEGCKYCGYEKIRDSLKLKWEDVEQLFRDKGLILLSLCEEYKNSGTPLKYICLKHKDKGIQLITVDSLKICDYGCNYCGFESKSRENHHNWKGGISPLHNYLRDKINDWKYDSLSKYNFKCALTNLETHELVVHHLYKNFSEIIMEALNILELPLHANISNYSILELEQIKEKTIQLHYKYGYGIPIIPELHELFHKKYSRIKNNETQFIEFTKDYYLGCYDDFLEEKYKSYNIKIKKEVS